MYGWRSNGHLGGNGTPRKTMCEEPLLGGFGIPSHHVPSSVACWLYNDCTTHGGLTSAKRKWFPYLRWTNLVWYGHQSSRNHPCKIYQDVTLKMGWCKKNITIKIILNLQFSGPRDFRLKNTGSSSTSARSHPRGRHQLRDRCGQKGILQLARANGPAEAPQHQWYHLGRLNTRRQFPFPTVSMWFLTMDTFWMSYTGGMPTYYPLIRLSSRYSHMYGALNPGKLTKND